MSFYSGATYAKDRTETEFDLPEKAKYFRRKVMKYCMNESRVPKRWRYFIGEPIVEKASAVRDYIIMANDIKADTDRKKELREEYRLKALSFCNLLQMDIEDMIDILDGCTYENMREITDDLVDIIKRVTKWK